MAGAWKVEAIVELERHWRLDGAADLLLQVRAGGAPGFLAVREGATQVVAVAAERGPGEPGPGRGGQSEAPDLVQAPRRRTRASGLAGLIRACPSILRSTRSAAERDLWLLQRDDREARKRALRLRRVWRIHELVRFVDGGFVARLSCRLPAGQLLSDPTQFVLEGIPVVEQEQRWLVLAKGDHLGGGPVEGLAASGRQQQLLDGLERGRPRGLAELLAGLATGWRFERDAIAAFEAALERREVERRRDFGRVSATRQPGADRDTAIRIVDCYEAAEPAWLLETGRGWLVMTTYGAGPFRQSSGRLKARFSHRPHPDVAFETPVATARILLRVVGDGTGLDETEARRQFDQVVADDLRQRLNRERADAVWLVTARARLGDGRVAVRATSLWRAAEFAPLEAPRPYWSILVSARIPASRWESEHDGVLDLSTGKEIVWFGEDAAAFARRFGEAVAALPEAAARRSLIDSFLARAAGFTDRAEADRAWAALLGSEAAEEGLDGDADPLPLALRRLAVDRQLAARRELLERQVAGGERSPDELRDHDRMIAQARAWPRQLVELVASLAARPAGEPPAIGLQDGVALRDGGTADGGAGEAPLAAAVGMAPAAGEARTGVAPGPVDAGGAQPDEAPRRRGGRPRLHEDDRARKRAWAAARRRELRADRGEQPPNRGGRPRIHASAAERKRAWRARRRGAGTDRDDGSG